MSVEAREALTCAWTERVGARAQGAERPSAQRPNRVYLPGLRAQPWWDTRPLAWVPRVEAAWRGVRDEVLALARRGYLTPRPAASLGALRRGDDALIDGEAGGWQLFRLWYRGVELRENTALCPVTAALVAQVPGFAGTVAVGVLLPGTHVRPHCGLSNARLRCHLGLAVPEGCAMRVDGETRGWSEGECLLFDDSFEHEVWHRGERVRYVLSFDLWHPELDEEDVRWLEQRDAFPSAQRVALEAATRWSASPNEEHPRSEA